MPLSSSISILLLLRLDFLYLNRDVHQGRLGGGGEKRAGYGRHQFGMPTHGYGDVVVADHLTGCGVKPLPAGAG